MAANDPRPVVPRPEAASAPKPKPAEEAGAKKPSLTFDEAELFASRIRPSWELVDDALRGELAAELGLPGPAAAATAAPAGAAKGQDTIIEGIPTVSIGSGPLALPPEEAPAPAPVRVEPAPAPAPVVKIPAPGRDGGAPHTPAGPAFVEPTKKAPPIPSRGGKTRAGVGEATKGVSKTLPDVAPSSKPAPVSKPGASRPGASKPGVSKPGVAAVSPSRSGDTDDIEIPGTGSSGAIFKIGLGLAAVVAVAAIGYGAFGGGGGGKTGDAATTTVTATAIARTATAVPLPATVPAPPMDPVPAVTTTAATPTATAVPTVAATVAARPTADPRPEPKKTVAANPDRPAVPRTSTPPTPPSTSKKGGGGIIRDSPF